MDWYHHHIPSDDLFAFLKQTENPTRETELLAEFIPDYQETMRHGSNLDIFKMHFILYHHLYSLAERVSQGGYVIAIRLIYVYLYPFPEPGRCRYFDEEAHEFCLQPTIQTEDNPHLFCKQHWIKKEQTRQNGILVAPGMKQYYLDKQNYHRMDETRLEKALDNFYLFVGNYNAIQRSLGILNVTFEDSFEVIQKRFRELSLRYHPDRTADCSMLDRYKEISGAYQVLKDYFAKVKQVGEIG
jgi:hypothetical protein